MVREVYRWTLMSLPQQQMISKHISDKEGVYSTTATRRGLDNVPSQFELANMKEIAEQVFEPLREWVGGPIRINSFYRGKALNKAIGGSTSSQHCKGQAMDVDDGGSYTQAPFEDITEAEFNKRVKLLNDVDLSKIIEATDETDLSGELACAGGSCEISSL